MDNEKLLYLLKSAGGPVSGQEISKELGVSRAAVWKSIEALRNQGYKISSATRRGYFLEESPDVLRSGEISALLNTKVVGKEFLCLDSIDSTNTECKRRMMNGGHAGLVITSEEQTGGRGRIGRKFESPVGKGLYLSAVLQPKLEPKDAINLTAWVAVAVCDAIEEACGIRPQIKWTNDIILGGKKLGGILTEMEVEAETNLIRYIVVGIGINCNHSLNDFPKELHEIATSLNLQLGKSIERKKLAVALTKALDRLNEDFPIKKEEYLTKYKKDCCTLGRQVKLIYSDDSFEEAYALDIDEDFRLIVRTQDGNTKAVFSGEVSVRGLCGYL